MKVTENLNRDSIVVDSGNGMGGSNAFSIKTNAKMFEMLSSKIYTDKILAPIRELSCNAYDAQVEAGNADTPIVITMPDYKNPIFAVTDRGLGMTVEQVMNQYTTYGESGKEDSNDYIGCLGLGSKSPLCYTDQFFIETTKDGQTNKFVCYYDNGTPMIRHTSSEDTGAPSGTTVSFAVKSSDIQEFSIKCSGFFKTFRPFPQFIGASFKAPGISKIGPMVNIGTSMKGLGGLTVLCSNVAYSFSVYSLTRGQQDELEKYCHYYVPTLLEVPIGSVDISVSRESLEITDKTIETIIEATKTVQKILVKECSDILNSSLGFVETVRRLNAVNRKSQGIRIPNEFSSWQYAIDRTEACGFDDLPYDATEYLRYATDDDSNTAARRLSYSGLSNIYSEVPVDVFAVLVTRSLKHNQKYDKYIAELHAATNKPQIMYVIRDSRLAECFTKLGITVIEEADLRKKLGMRVMGASGTSKKPKTELNLEGKDLDAVAAGWRQRRVDAWGPGELKPCNWFNVALIFKRLAESESTEILYLPYTSNRTAIDYATVRSKINNGYSIDVITPTPTDPNTWFSVSSDATRYGGYADRMTKLISLLQALCGEWVLVLSDSAYQSIPDKLKPRFVNLYEKVRQLAHNETGDLERLWKSGAFKLKPFLRSSVANPVLTPDLFKGHDGAYQLSKFIHKNYHKLSEVDKALIQLFDALPEAPKDRDYSVLNHDHASAAGDLIDEQFPLLSFLTYAPEEHVENYIQAMKKFNKSKAKKGNKENE